MAKTTLGDCHSLLHIELVFSLAFNLSINSMVPNLHELAHTLAIVVIEQTEFKEKLKEVRETAEAIINKFE